MNKIVQWAHNVLEEHRRRRNDERFNLGYAEAADTCLRNKGAIPRIEWLPYVADDGWLLAGWDKGIYDYSQQTGIDVHVIDESE